MSRIDELIVELCPEGVQQTTIDRVCLAVSSGGTPSTSRRDYYGGSIPWLRTQEVNFGVINSTEETITESGLKNSAAKVVSANTVIVAMYGATAAKVAITAIPLTTNQACCNLQVNPEVADYRYVFYWLWSQYENLRALGEGSQANLNARKIRSYPIPLPPLAIQQEIVKILDIFTELEAELETELEARKKQYEYYREELLTFAEDEVEWKAIGDFAELVRGHGLPKSDFAETGTGCIHYGQIYTHYGTWTTTTLSKVSAEKARSLVKVDPGDVIVTSTSENLEDVCTPVAWLGDDSIVTGGHATVLKHNENAKFIAYYMQTQKFGQEKRKYAFGTKVIDVATRNLAKIAIPLPSLAEQQRIVDILDKFDALVNDLSSGIPAEIEARRKQYEHYRNRLLTFKKLPI